MSKSNLFKLLASIFILILLFLLPNSKVYAQTCTATQTGTTATVNASVLTPSSDYIIRSFNNSGQSLQDSNPITAEITGTFSYSNFPLRPDVNVIRLATAANPSNLIATCGSITLNSSGTSTFDPGKNPCTDSSNNPIDCPTALGDIPTDATQFTGKLLRVAIGLAGGIALIIMVRGAIKLLMAAGDPQKIQDGRDLIIAAIAGLLFLIFSVLILRFIGNDLIGLGGVFQ